MGPKARHSVGKFASPAAEPTLGDVAGVDKGEGASSFNACSENEMGRGTLYFAGLPLPRLVLRTNLRRRRLRLLMIALLLRVGVPHA